MVGSGAEVLVKIHGLLGCFCRDFSFSMEIVRSRKLTFLDGSSNSHSKMPKLLVSFLKSSQLCSSGLPIQVPTMSSMNLRNSSSLLLNYGMRDDISWTEKYIVAHMQAADVPMAVPSNWRK